MVPSLSHSHSAIAITLGLLVCMYIYHSGYGSPEITTALWTAVTRVVSNIASCARPYSPDLEIQLMQPVISLPVFCCGASWRGTHIAKHTQKHSFSE